MTSQLFFNIVISLSLAIIAGALCVLAYHLVKVFREFYKIQKKGEWLADIFSTVVSLIKKPGRKKSKDNN